MNETTKLLEAMRRMYRSFNSYEDEGEVKATFKMGKEFRYQHYFFSTFYKRPGRLILNFWFTEQREDYAIRIVSDNNEVYAFRSGSSIPAKKCDSLQGALSLIGTFCSLSSDGFAIAIPEMLDKKFKGVGDSAFFDEDCRLIENSPTKLHFHQSIHHSLIEKFSEAHILLSANFLPEKVTLHGNLSRQTMLAMIDKMKTAVPMTSQAYETTLEFLQDCESHLERAYSRVLHDHEFDESIFEVPH